MYIEIESLIPSVVKSWLTEHQDTPVHCISDNNKKTFFPITFRRLSAIDEINAGCDAVRDYARTVDDKQ